MFNAPTSDFKVRVAYATPLFVEHRTSNLETSIFTSDNVQKLCWLQPFYEYLHFFLIVAPVLLEASINSPASLSRIVFSPR